MMMQINKKPSGLVALILVFSFNVSYVKAQEINREYILTILDHVSNWGRWGGDDELGTLNFITEQERVAAARQVAQGVSISLAFDLTKQATALNPNPMKHHLQITEFAGDTWAVDTYTINYHGFAFSHIDALCHFLYQGKMYNDFSGELVKPDGVEKLGIQNMSEGIFTRGILVDVPELKGVPYLEPGTAILPEDLDAWESKTGITIGRGDVLLVRTGRWANVATTGEWNYVESAAGLHPSVVEWLHERQVAVLGSDGGSERYPSGLKDSQSPVHFLALYGMGMPILDNLNLEDLSVYAKENARYEFLFTAAPLRVVGGTGSPLNPIATF